MVAIRWSMCLALLFHSWWAALFPTPISRISDFFGFDALQTVSRTNFLNTFPYKRSNCKLFVRSSVLWPICSNDDHWKRISHTHTNSLIWNRIEFVSETKFSSNLKYAKVFKKRSHLLNFTFKKKKPTVWSCIPFAVISMLYLQQIPLLQTVPAWLALSVKFKNWTLYLDKSSCSKLNVSEDRSKYGYVTLFRESLSESVPELAPFSSVFRLKSGKWLSIGTLAIRILVVAVSVTNAFSAPKRPA